MRKFFLVLLALTLFGCSKDDSSTDPILIPTAKAIYPLAVGNQWIYKHSVTSVQDTLTINNSFYLDGDSVYTFMGNDDFSFELDTDNQGFFYRDKDLWTLIYGVKKLFIPYVRGTSYFTVRSDSVKTLSILSTNENVTVPAGTFNCCKYYYVAVGGNVGKFYWLADGVGVVKLQYEGSAEYYELISYTLK